MTLSKTFLRDISNPPTYHFSERSMTRGDLNRFHCQFLPPASLIHGGSQCPSPKWGHFEWTFNNLAEGGQYRKKLQLMTIYTTVASPVWRYEVSLSSSSTGMGSFWTKEIFAFISAQPDGLRFFLKTFQLLSRRFLEFTTGWGQSLKI